MHKATSLSEFAFQCPFSCSWRVSSIRIWTLLSLCTTGDGITIRSQILCQILFHLSCCFKRHRI